MSASTGRSRRWWPQTLRARLVSAVVGLLVLGFAAVALITLVVVRHELLDRLDAQLRAAGTRFSTSLEHPDHDADNDPGQYGAVEGQAAGTLGARILNATVTSAAVIAANNATGQVTAADRAVLANLQVTDTPRSIDLPHLGAYRVLVSNGRDGDLQVTGLPYAPVRDTIDDLVLTEVIVFAAVLAAVALASAALVGMTLRPLRRVAATAQTVAATPMATGRVSLPARASSRSVGTEIDTLERAFNAMLEEVEAALHERHTGEEQLRRFVADASHELRTPVAVVRSHAEHAERAGGTELPEQVRHSLRRIVVQAERMGHVVGDLLLLARLDSGRRLQYEDVDFSRLVLDAVDDARTIAADHRWVLRLPEKPVVLVGDSSALHQIVGNLLSNARMHTPPGTAVTTSVSAGQDYVRLEVADDGPGVPADLAGRVFDRFVRSESSRASGTGSSGLGLPIVAALVAAHHGDVELTPGPGGLGTRVTVIVPRTLGDAGIPAASIGG